MKRIIPIIILLAIVGGGYWWLNQPAPTPLPLTSEAETLLGSGTIEAEKVAITAELGGRVIELKVDEGDEVKAGQVLVKLDQTDLLAQQLQLEAALTTAKTNLELIEAVARPEDIAVAQAKLAQAEVARDGAQQIWQRLEDLVRAPHQLEAKVDQAQAQVSEAERNLEFAQVNLKRADIQAEAAGRSQATRLGGNEGLVQSEAAQYQLQAAQTSVELTKVALAGARLQVEHWIGIRDRPLQLIAQANSAKAAYHRAEAAVLVAETDLKAVQADPTPEDIAVAQAQVHEAEAALAALDVQLAKQTLTAPRAGLITRKLVDPGELAPAGTALLELSDIATVDLTVYIPETQIGRVKIGHKAWVYVDAYDSEQFEGQVSFIAHQAEFTPRNIQTQEERVNLVFAVKITLDNADHRLLPGMPADAAILITSQPSPPKGSSATLPPQVTITPSATPGPIHSPTPTATGPKATATTITTPAMEAKPTLEAEVISWGLRVRSGPGVDYPVVAFLAQGDIVPVLKVDPDTQWLQVQDPSNGKVGWISGKPAYVTTR